MISLRRIVRAVAPMPLRLGVAVARRTLADWRNAPAFASTRTASLDGLTEAVTISQPIRRTAHFEGKLHNIDRAAQTLNNLSVPAGATVSFWHLIGRPSARRGYRTGRAIIGDRLSSDIGGGLCQVASLLYELGLRAGMTTVERHPHSRDLYTEETRFTPLGLDAAIVWGFKDVRWQNPHDATTTLGFSVEDETVTGRLLAGVPIAAYDLEIARRDEGPLRHVEITRSSGLSRTIVSRDTYAIDAM